jgi:hypothetical protein
MMQVSKFFTRDLQLTRSTPRSNDLVVFLVLADWHFWTDDVTNLVEVLCQFLLQSVSLLSLLLNFTIECF